MDAYNTMPAAPDIEKIVLCSLMIDRKIYDKYALTINLDYFYDSKYKSIFAYMQENNTNESTLLCNKFAQDIDLISSILDSASILALEPYLKILEDKFLRREIIKIANDAVQSAATDIDSPAESIKDTLTSALSGLVGHRKLNQPECIANILSRVFDHIECVKTGGAGYINTGLVDVDEITGVFSPGELIIIAARPGMGKSSLAANILRHNAIRKKIPTLLFSLEMDKILSAGRIIFSEAFESYDDAMKCRMDDTRIAVVAAKAEEVKNSPIIIDETPAITMQEIIQKTLWHRQNSLIGLVIIDHIGLIGIHKPGRSRNEEMGVISSGLKSLARTAGISIIALSQLSREVERRNPPIPLLSDLRDSGNIEQDADKVIMLYRGEKYFPNKEELKGICQVIIAKNRNGPDGYRDVCFNSRTMNFYDRAYEKENF